VSRVNGDGRSGFTLIEVIIAIVILSVVLLGLAGTVGKLGVEVKNTTDRTRAIQLAESRVTEIELTPEYDSLADWYAGTESNVDSTDYTRITRILQRGGTGSSATMNHKVITVEVTGNGLTPPVTRTTVVGAP